ncbi:MAG: ATP-binding protein [Candidatus Roizmanbacteria bacterium]|nr:ATP-binding protein [Candidatus Roizmanbacteria bacterium]
MIYKRSILPQIEKYIEKKEIIVLTGMRRVGKTTLLKQVFDGIKSENKILLDIENPLTRSYFEEIDFNNIWNNLGVEGLDKTKKAYIFLDEIQAMPEITKAIKYLYDHYDVKFFVTGSSSYYLKNLFPESLAGRKFEFELFPLSFEEFLLFKGVENPFYKSITMTAQYKNKIKYEKTKQYYAEYMLWGGFPEVVLESNLETKKMKLNDIFKAYFEKEVKGLADFSNLSRFRDLMILLVSRVGSKLDISKLASEVGTSRQTINSYLSFLQATYFLSLVPPFSKNIDREVSGSNKVYICDTGLINLLEKVSMGSVLENAVFLNLKKYGKLQYYDKRKGGEIDFILNENCALEVKNKAIDQHFNALKKMSQTLGLKNYYIVGNLFVDKNYVIEAQDL